MRLQALALIALGIAAAGGRAATIPDEPSATNTAADVLSFERRGNLMAVPVKVTGRGPYPFLVDSGAERTVISRELAQQLALQPGPNVRIHSMTEVSTLATAVIPHLQFSKRQVTDIQAPALPAEHIGAAGVLGVDTLKRQKVEFDFARRTMTILPSRGRDHQDAPNAIVITAKTRYGRLVITNVQIDGQDVIAVLDTGSDFTLGNKALQTSLARRGRLGPMVPLQVASITGQHFIVDYTRVKRLAVSDLTVSNMAVGFADVHIFRQLRLENRPAIMLGMDTLKLFGKVSVDFARKEVRFELPQAQPNTLAMAAPVSP